jgi:succinoglycan biosynthesis protein ExoM
MEACELMGTAIDICICTFQRPYVRQTLLSLSRLHVQPDCVVRVIVADNDDTDSARSTVEATALETGLSVLYIHAPARNIAVARNACLDVAGSPLVTFIDDDELVTPQWLAAMLATLNSSGADAVFGPVRAQYPQGCPEWIRTGDFHSTFPVWVGSSIVTGYSCNVLFKRLSPALKDLRFRKEFGKSGGEDTVFFSTAYKAGARFAYSAEGVITEDIVQNRLSFGWLLKRRFRSGQTHGVLLLENAGTASRLVNIGKAAAKFLFCTVMAILTVFKGTHMRYWLLRGAVHAGVVSRLLGKRELEQYGLEKSA